MRTVQEIFDKAIHLIDAQNEQSGSTDTADTREYKVRCCELLNTLLNEAYPYSDTYNQKLPAWDANVRYQVGDKVEHQGVRYVCYAAGTDGVMTPGDPRYWKVLSRPGMRPTHPPVYDMHDQVDMDDFICMSALPAGLAALFVYDEDTTKYNAYWGDYQSRLAQARATLPAADGWEDIENPYAWEGYGAGIEHGEYGRWNF